VASVAQRSPLVDGSGGDVQKDASPSRCLSLTGERPTLHRHLHPPPSTPNFAPSQGPCRRLQNWLATAACETNSLQFLRPLFLCCSPTLIWLISLTFCSGPRSTFRITARHPPHFLSRRAACLGRKRAISAPDQTKPSSPCHTKARERPVELQ
jgi:hypothetical protein